jgi:hypothetical protein
MRAKPAKEIGSIPSKDVIIIEIVGDEQPGAASFPNTKEGNKAAMKFFREGCEGLTRTEITEAINSGHMQNEVQGGCCGSVNHEMYLYRPQKENQKTTATLHRNDGKNILAGKTAKV